MDGVRGYWSGDALLSRQGNMFPCPPWFTATLPCNMSLDGELWMGRSNTHVTVTALLNSNSTNNHLWGQLRYCIFDIPSSLGTYEQRMREMEALKDGMAPHIEIVENARCKGIDDLLSLLDSVVTAKGEGIMLREPQAPYLLGPTASLLKVKVNKQVDKLIFRNMKIPKLSC